MMFRKTAGAAALAATLAPFASAHAAAPSNEELYQSIQALQAEVKALKEQLATQPPAAAAPAAAPAPATAAAITAPVAAEAAVSKVKLGGYGELHYNNLDNDTTKKDKKEIDFHRFVLFAGYDFTDKIRFVSELELEHSLAGDGTTPNGSKAKPGEIELEQAYIEFDLPAQQRAKAGLFLVPVGMLNEVHEPTTFYGVERNPVESNIIPTTWWEGGAALGGLFGATGLSYDLAVHSGLAMPVSGSNAFKPRSGRQKVAEARAENLAYTVRLNYTGVPGLKAGVSAQYQEDATQNLDATAVEAVLTEAHVAFDYRALSARALWAQWDLKSKAAAALDRDEQEGYYGELAYRVLPKLGLFGRYSAWNNGGAGATEIRQENYGLNYWPVDGVVLKADYQLQDGDDNFDGFNLGVGYHF